MSEDDGEVYKVLTGNRLDDGVPVLERTGTGEGILKLGFAKGAGVLEFCHPGFAIIAQVEIDDDAVVKPVPG